MTRIIAAAIVAAVMHIVLLFAMTDSPLQTFETNTAPIRHVHNNEFY